MASSFIRQGQMATRHITSVMVADGDHLLGVLHMHDLLRAGVV